MDSPQPRVWPISGAWFTLGDGDDVVGDSRVGEELGRHLGCREQCGKGPGGVPGRSPRAAFLIPR